tara:strand:+ start:360 stop:536 length:177 start_codon:yes stop_codon:yes gene_type:complete
MNKFQKENLEKIKTALNGFYCLKFYKMGSNMQNQNINTVEYMKDKIEQILNGGRNEKL